MKQIKNYILNFKKSIKIKLKKFKKKLFSNKTRNKILKTITAISVIIFILSICSVDSETWMPCITAIISLVWICLFTYANKHLLEQ